MNKKDWNIKEYTEEACRKQKQKELEDNLYRIKDYLDLVIETMGNEKEVLKVFISQPMNGRTNREIEVERNSMIKVIKEFYPDKKIIILNSFFKDAPHDAKPLWYLGESIKLLSQADIAFFAKGWKEARGCNIEAQCAFAYGIKRYDI